MKWRKSRGARPRDREVLHGPGGLDPVVRLRRNLPVAEQIVLLAREARGFGRRPVDIQRPGHSDAVAQEVAHAGHEPVEEHGALFAQPFDVRPHKLEYRSP